MAELHLHGRPISSIFELLGANENDITYSLGWALANSPSLTRAVLEQALGSGAKHGTDEIRLQERVPDSGITDILILGPTVRAIVEAKRGWQLPSVDQLALYVPRFREDERSHQVLLTMSEASREFAALHLPQAVDGVSVAHLAWKDIIRLSRQPNAGHAEKRLLAELCTYLARIVSMQNQESNLVYVVSLGRGGPEWSSLSWIDIVEREGRYFHPVGPSGGWPKEPPNYLGFRYSGRLQRIHHVEEWKVVQDLHREIRGMKQKKLPRPLFLYTLGPAITPDREVRTGNIYPNGRVWAMLDLLLTSETISEARDQTRARRQQDD